LASRLQPIGRPRKGKPVAQGIASLIDASSHPVGLP
jgi:hypothetical protein